MSDDTREALGGPKGVHVRESIVIARPPAEVYGFWRRFENLPRVMSHLESVTALDDRRSHWIAKGPAGMRVEWDAEVINDVDAEVIGWRSLEGADVVTAGSVNFKAVPGGTAVAVHFQYAPPAGRAGATVAKLLGQDPARIVREDLAGLKAMLEGGAADRQLADLSAPAEG